MCSLYVVSVWHGSYCEQLSPVIDIAQDHLELAINWLNAMGPFDGARSNIWQTSRYPITCQGDFDGSSNSSLAVNHRLIRSRICTSCVNLLCNDILFMHKDLWEYENNQIKSKVLAKVGVFQHHFLKKRERWPTVLLTCWIQH